MLKIKIKIKKIFFRILKIFIFILGSILFLGQEFNFSIVYAGKISENKKVIQENKNLQTRDKTLQSFVETLDVVLKVITILISPLLMIAGWALSNNFVNGSLFYIDDALRQFWNVMRNVSMFIVGFLVVFSILTYLLFPNFQKRVHPKNILSKILLAVIFVNTSWWIMGALLDISTVLTINFGTLPLQIVGKNGEELKVYKTFSYIPNSSIIEKGQTKPINGITLYAIKKGEYEYYIPPCIFSGGSIIDGKFWNTYTNTLSNELKKFKKDDVSLGSAWCLTESATGVKILNVGSCIQGKCEDATDVELEQTSLYPLISKIKNFVGPLYFLYGSLINFYGLRDYVIGGGVGVGTISLVFIIKLVLAIMLMLPLVALAAVLVMRGFMLWFIIAFSPLLFLIWTVDIAKLKNIANKFSLANVLALIFLPVTVTLALSIGIIILGVLNGLIGQAKSGTSRGLSPIEESLEISIKSKKSGSGETVTTIDLPGGAKLNFVHSAKQIGSDIGENIGAIFLSILAAMIVWSIVFAALKTSSLTSSVVDTIETFGKGLASTAPVIPTPWGMQSIGSLSTAASSIQQIPQTIATEQFSRSPINKFFDRMSSEFSGKKEEWKNKLGKVTKVFQLNDAINSIPKGYSLADQEIFDAIKEKLVSFAPADIKDKLNKIGSLSDLGKYPEVIDWLKENKIDIKSLISPSTEPYHTFKFREIRKNFIENLKEAQGSLKKLSTEDEKTSILIHTDGKYAYIYNENNPDSLQFFDLDNNNEDLRQFLKQVAGLKLKDISGIESIIRNLVNLKLKDAKSAEDKGKLFRKIFGVDSNEFKVVAGNGGIVHISYDKKDNKFNLNIKITPLSSDNNENT